ncbi:putative PEP-binding protein, partial [Candidatus Omnitrophota bacterium]
PDLDTDAEGPYASGNIGLAGFALTAGFLGLSSLTGINLFAWLGRYTFSFTEMGALDYLVADYGKRKAKKDRDKGSVEGVKGSKQAEGAWKTKMHYYKMKLIISRMWDVICWNGEILRYPWQYRNCGMGGAHVKKEYPNSNISFQESMFMPVGAKNPMEAQEWTVRLQRKLRDLIDSDEYPGCFYCGVGSEGGISVFIKPDPGDILPIQKLWRIARRAIVECGLTPGEQVMIALDPALSELEKAFRKLPGQAKDAIGKYVSFLPAGSQPTQILGHEDIIKIYQLAIERDDIPIVSLEDGFAEDDHSGWQKLMRLFGKVLILVGDDIATTKDENVDECMEERNEEKIDPEEEQEEGQEGLFNAVLIKNNQIGLLCETILAMMVTMAKGGQLVISHRSKSPMDSFEAQLALAVMALGLKAGGGSNDERLWKYFDAYIEMLEQARLRELMEAQEEHFKDLESNSKNGQLAREKQEIAGEEELVDKFMKNIVITDILADEEPLNTGIPTGGVTVFGGIPESARFSHFLKFSGATPKGASTGDDEATDLRDYMIEECLVTERHGDLFEIIELEEKKGVKVYEEHKILHFRFKDQVTLDTVRSRNDPELLELFLKANRYLSKGDKGDGMGCLTAVENVIKILAPKFLGRKISDIGDTRDIARVLLASERDEHIIRRMRIIRLNGQVSLEKDHLVSVMQKKMHLGMNAILPFDLALNRLVARTQGKSLWLMLREQVKNTSAKAIVEKLAGEADIDTILAAIRQQKNAFIASRKEELDEAITKLEPAFKESHGDEFAKLRAILDDKDKRTEESLSRAKVVAEANLKKKPLWQLLSENLDYETLILGLQAVEKMRKQGIADMEYLEQKERGIRTTDLLRKHLDIYDIDVDKEGLEAVAAKAAGLGNNLNKDNTPGIDQAIAAQKYESIYSGYERHITDQTGIAISFYVLTTQPARAPPVFAKEKAGKNKAGIYLSKAAHDFFKENFSEKELAFILPAIAIHAKAEAVDAKSHQEAVQAHEKYLLDNLNLYYYFSPRLAGKLRIFMALAALTTGGLQQSRYDEAAEALSSIAKEWAGPVHALDYEVIQLAKNAIKQVLKTKGIEGYVCNAATEALRQVNDIEVAKVSAAAEELLGKDYIEETAHGKPHSDELIEKARLLIKEMGIEEEVDWTVLAIEIYLHDIFAAKSKHHGKDAARYFAKYFKGRLFLTEAQAVKIKEGIILHDKKASKAAIARRARSAIEAQIFYDVDNWAAFGVKGIYRYIIAWLGRGDDLSKVLDDVNMRFASACFVETQELARADYDIIKAFFRKLNSEDQQDSNKLSASGVVTFIRENLGELPWMIALKAEEELDDHDKYGWQVRLTDDYKFTQGYFKALRSLYIKDALSDKKVIYYPGAYFDVAGIAGLVKSCPSVERVVLLEGKYCFSDPAALKGSSDCFRNELTKQGFEVLKESLSADKRTLTIRAGLKTGNRIINFKFIEGSIGETPLEVKQQPAIHVIKYLDAEMTHGTHVDFYAMMIGEMKEGDMLLITATASPTQVLPVTLLGVDNFGQEGMWSFIFKRARVLSVNTIKGILEADDILRSLQEYKLGFRQEESVGDYGIPRNRSEYLGLVKQLKLIKDALPDDIQEAIPAFSPARVSRGRALTCIAGILLLTGIASAAIPGTGAVITLGSIVAFILMAVPILALILALSGIFTIGRAVVKLASRAWNTPAARKTKVNKLSCITGHESKSKTSEKGVYFFGTDLKGNNLTEGEASMKDLLGGKGANLAQMARLRYELNGHKHYIRVPCGFTITTDEAKEYDRTHKLSPRLIAEIEENLAKIEAANGRNFGADTKPLLLSVRSGARVSMPGMMDTILNIGLNDTTVEILAAEFNNERFAWDSYRRLVMMFGDVVLGLGKEGFEHIFEAEKKAKGATSDLDLDAVNLKKIVTEFKSYIRSQGKEFPQDVKTQLFMAIEAVFKSSNNPRARAYKQMNNIPMDTLSAVNVQTMVFGNLNESSATGVGFTRDPATGENVFYAEYLVRAQGEDIVAGVRTPMPVNADGREKFLSLHAEEFKGREDEIITLEQFMPDVYRQLEAIYLALEAYYKDMQDIEFTIQDGALYMLQTRTGKRTAFAALNILMDLYDAGVIDEEEAVMQLAPGQIDEFLHPIFDPADKEKAKAEGRLLTKGLNASPGAAAGKVVFTSTEAEEAVKADKKTKVILVRLETSAEDVSGMKASEGILTARGGMTSHAAVVARGMGKTAVVGAGALVINEKEGYFKVGDRRINAGDIISIDGYTGEVLVGKLKTMDSVVIRGKQDVNYSDEEKRDIIKSALLNLHRTFKRVRRVLKYLFPGEDFEFTIKEVSIGNRLTPQEQKLFQRYELFFKWVDKYRMTIRTNAETHDDVLAAVKYFDIDGIGLARTEHMFFIDRAPGENRVHKFRKMILEGKAELNPQTMAQLTQYQQADFEDILTLLEGRPATIRLVDPPLHEFLPHPDSDEGMAAITALSRELGMNVSDIIKRIHSMKEANPMFGFRGDRLMIVHPEIAAMQVRAILGAYKAVKERNLAVSPVEIMIPLVGVLEEFIFFEDMVEKIAKEEFGFKRGRKDEGGNYLIGTMIEVPSGVITADEIATHADFFSFGTNDLTQSTFEFSRDDAGNIVIPVYMSEKVYILGSDPFKTLDPGVGELVRITAALGKSVNPKLKVGICGEQGGDPQSIANEIIPAGLDYASCSPFRVPGAKLASAQKYIRDRRERRESIEPYDLKRLTESDEKPEAVKVHRTENRISKAILRALILFETFPIKTEDALDELEAVFDSSRQEIYRALADILDHDNRAFISLYNQALGEVFEGASEDDLRELSDKLSQPIDDIRSRIKKLHEANPALGNRGLRQALTGYERTFIVELTAIARLVKENPSYNPHLVVPLLVDVREFVLFRELVNKVFKITGADVSRIKLGAPIQTPRAALRAADFAREADFLIFEIQGLTESVLATTKEDAYSFLPAFVNLGIYAEDPFKVMPEKNVGKFMRIAIQRAREARQDLPIYKTAKNLEDEQAGARIIAGLNNEGLGDIIDLDDAVEVTTKVIGGHKADAHYFNEGDLADYGGAALVELKDPQGMHSSDDKYALAAEYDLSDKDFDHEGWEFLIRKDRARVAKALEEVLGKELKIEDYEEPEEPEEKPASAASATTAIQTVDFSPEGQEIRRHRVIMGIELFAGISAVFILVPLGFMSIYVPLLKLIDTWLVARHLPLLVTKIVAPAVIFFACIFDCIRRMIIVSAYNKTQQALEPQIEEVDDDEGEEDYCSDATVVAARNGRVKRERATGRDRRLEARIRRIKRSLNEDLLPQSRRVGLSNKLAELERRKASRRTLPCIAGIILGMVSVARANVVDDCVEVMHANTVFGAVTVVLGAIAFLLIMMKPALRQRIINGLKESLFILAASSVSAIAAPVALIARKITGLLDGKASRIEEILLIVALVPFTVVLMPCALLLKWFIENRVGQWIAIGAFCLVAACVGIPLAAVTLPIWLLIKLVKSFSAALKRNKSGPALACIAGIAIAALLLPRLAFAGTASAANSLISCTFYPVWFMLLTGLSVLLCNKLYRMAKDKILAIESAVEIRPGHTLNEEEGRRLKILGGLILRLLISSLAILVLIAMALLPYFNLAILIGSFLSIWGPIAVYTYRLGFNPVLNTLLNKLKSSDSDSSNLLCIAGIAILGAAALAALFL